MTTIAFTEAKSMLSALIDRVANGEEITITRHNEPVAKLVPAKRSSREDMKRLIEDFKASRKRGPKVTLDEIIAWKNFGRP
jgi:prevent-host-death family protein